MIPFPLPASGVTAQQTTNGRPWTWWTPLAPNSWNFNGKGAVEHTRTRVCTTGVRGALVQIQSSRSINTALCDRDRRHPYLGPARPSSGGIRPIQFLKGTPAVPRSRSAGLRLRDQPTRRRRRAYRVTIELTRCAHKSADGRPGEPRAGGSQRAGAGDAECGGVL